jgi:hypothetical protein
MRVRRQFPLRSNEFAETAHTSLDLSAESLSAQPAADDVLAEIGLVLVVVLGIVLAVNAVLISLHITP